MSVESKVFSISSHQRTIREHRGLVLHAPLGVRHEGVERLAVLGPGRVP